MPFPAVAAAAGGQSGAATFAQVAGGAASLGGLVTDLSGGILYKPIMAQQEYREGIRRYDQQMDLSRDQFNLNRMQVMQQMQEQRRKDDWRRRFARALGTSSGAADGGIS